MSFVLGDTEADAQERAHHIRRQQVSPQTAILLLEQLWNRDLSGYDAEGPLPGIDPDVILVPHLTPGGLDGFVDQVVPLLQERGVLRTEYESTTLRGNLGLA